MASDESESPDSLASESESETPPTLLFEIDERLAGGRVDAVLASLIDESRAQVRRWIDAGRVRVGGEAVRASRILLAGECVEAIPLSAVPMEVEPEAIPLVVLFEDSHLIVVDKPAGLVVHPAPGHPSGTLVNALLHHCRDLAGVGGVLRPGIVHRLDRGTSGVLVAAKNDAAHVGLSGQFAAHSIERRYHTFVRGVPGADKGRIDRPIGRHPRDRKRMSVVSKAGRESATNWQVLRRFPRAGVAELAVRPETGRTHQIRVHLASVGLPLVGDVVYGRARGRNATLGRPALHAECLGFDHPATGERLRFEAPLPPDLESLARELAEGEPVE